MRWTCKRASAIELGGEKVCQKTLSRQLIVQMFMSKKPTNTQRKNLSTAIASKPNWGSSVIEGPTAGKRILSSPFFNLCWSKCKAKSSQHLIYLLFEASLLVFRCFSNNSSEFNELGEFTLTSSLKIEQKKYGVFWRLDSAFELVWHYVKPILFKMFGLCPVCIKHCVGAVQLIYT